MSEQQQKEKRQQHLLPGICAQNIFGLRDGDHCSLQSLLLCSIRWGFVEAYVIPSGSMLPSLLIHDHIFVNKLTYGLRVPFSENWLVKFSEPKRGEVIVFKFPKDMSTFFIKRIVGEAGTKSIMKMELYILMTDLLKKECQRI